MNLILKFSDSKSSLVFCSTRRMAREAACVIAREYEVLRRNGSIELWGQAEFDVHVFKEDMLRGEIKQALQIDTYFRIAAKADSISPCWPRYVRPVAGRKIISTGRYPGSLLYHYLGDGSEWQRVGGANDCRLTFLHILS